LAVLDTEQNRSRFGAFCGDPAVVLPLVTTYAAFMPFYSILPQMELDVPIDMNMIYALAGPGSRELFYSGRMGDEWTTPNRIIDCFCLAVLKHESRIGCFNITIDDRREIIQPEELQELAFLAPHIRRAVTIGDLFEMEQREAAVFREVIDAFGSAVFIVAGDMKLLHANIIAEAMLRDKVMVQSTSNYLQFLSPMADAALRNAVAMGERSEIALGTAGIGVPLAQISHPAIAHLLPLTRRSKSSEFHSTAAAAIFVATAGTKPFPALDAITALFGLTAAEKRVLAQVARGLTRMEIANASGVADGTIKSQLNAIYDKTGTSSQRALELLINDLTPPLRNKE
jgi:DNA-binding CsgD family transcriptional regulator